MPIQNKEDLRYYLEQDRIALKRPAGFVLKKDNIWKFEILLRKAEYYCNCMPGILKKIGSIYKRRLYRLGMKCGGFSIPVNCFGPGLSIAHGGTIIVNDTARIGKNCRIVYLVGKINVNVIIVLFLQVIVGAGYYLAMSCILHFEPFIYLVKMLKEKFGNA